MSNADRTCPDCGQEPTSSVGLDRPAPSQVPAEEVQEPDSWLAIFDVIGELLPVMVPAILMAGTGFLVFNLTGLIVGAIAGIMISGVIIMLDAS